MKLYLKRCFLFVCFAITACKVQPLTTTRTSSPCNIAIGVESISPVDWMVDTNGVPVFWAGHSLPIRIQMDQNLSPTRRRIVIQAVDFWNESIERQVFVIDHSPPWADDGSVYIMNDPLDDARDCSVEALALTRYEIVRRGNRSFISKSLIRFSDKEEFTEERFFQTAVHELGHVLGLQHDSNQLSIMYPLLVENNPWIIEFDDLEYIRFQTSESVILASPERQ